MSKPLTSPPPVRGPPNRSAAVTTTETQTIDIERAEREDRLVREHLDLVQAVVAGWFGQNLLQIVLTGSALALLFYFVPKTVNRPLANPGLARAGFWLLLLTGGWGGLAQLPSVPAWIPAVSGAANVLVVVPMLVELATSAWIALRPPTTIPPWSARVGLLLLAVIWLSTFFLQVPLHDRLSRGHDLAAIDSLVRGNAIRTAAWTARALLVTWWISRLRP